MRNISKSKIFGVWLSIFSSVELNAVDRPIHSSEKQCDSLEAEVPILITDAFPQNYIDPNNNKVIGTDAALLTDLLCTAGMRPQFLVTSWQRAVTTTKREKNHLIMPLSRSTEREEEFIWLHPIRRTWYSIFGKGRAPLSKEAIINSGKAIYCENGGIQCDLLIEAGFPREIVKTFPDASTERVMELVIRGRLTYFVAERHRIMAGIEAQGVKPEELRVLYTIPTPVEDYIATGASSTPEFVNKILQASRVLLRRQN